MTSVEHARDLDRLRNELAGIYAKHDTGKIDPDTGVPVYDMDTATEEECFRRNEELEAKTKQWELLRKAEMAQKNMEELSRLNQIDRRIIPPVGGGRTPADSSYPFDVSGKSIGQQVVESFEFKNRHQMRNKFFLEIPDTSFKTLLTTAGTPGFTAPNPRTDMIVPFAQRRPIVADLISTTPTSLSVVKWMEQVTFTNSAGMVAEGAVKPESEFDWDEVSSTVRKIAHFIPITEEQMDDIPGFMSLLNNDMVLGIKLKEEDQLVNGSGTGNNLLGFLNHSNIQSQAFSTNNADTILKAMTKVSWTGYARTTGIVMHPTNWETTRLIKGATNSDYVLGSPLLDITPRLWGVPVIITNVIAAGTALVGDFVGFSQIFMKLGVRVDVSDSHSDWFIYNKLAVRAEERLALVIKRGAAFCKATSLT